MTQRWNVHRSLSGILAPLSCLAAAAVLLIVAIYRLGEPWVSTTGRPADSATMIIVAMVASLGAAALEVQIRRQLTLARRGELTDAIIDDVSDHRWRREGGIRVEYHFSTASGQWIDGTCHIDSTEAITVVRGTKQEILYDPSNPSLNRLMLHLWGVEYEGERHAGT